LPNIDNGQTKKVPKPINPTNVNKLTHHICWNIFESNNAIQMITNGKKTKISIIDNLPLIISLFFLGIGMDGTNTLEFSVNINYAAPTPGAGPAP
jgi:hypothetical protein